MQTDFRNEAMLRQHEEGPAHKKALARQKAEREREAWAANPSAAANALVRFAHRRPEMNKLNVLLLLLHANAYCKLHTASPGWLEAKITCAPR